MQCKRKYRSLYLLALSLIIGIVFAGCQQPAVTPELPDDPFYEEQLPQPVADLILSYLQDMYASSGTVYTATDPPGEPQEGDVRIDSIIYAGEAQLYETIGVAYEIESSHYYFLRENADDEGDYSWNADPPYYVVLQRSGYDDSWYGVLGFDYVQPDKDVKDVIHEVAYNLMDIEVSLSLDGYPQLVGPGSTSSYFNEEFQRDILDEGHDTYYEGDYWLRLSYKDFTAICYYNEEEDVVTTNSIETTRTDVATHRGLRIGMTRAEVLSAYPTIYDSQYWGLEGDYLWYCNNDEGWGAALLFWFEDDVVTELLLINMFN